MRQMQRLRNIDINNAKLRSLGLDGLGKRSRDEERAPRAKRARHGPPPSSEWRRSSRGVERAQTNNNERERELLEGVEARPLLSLDEAQAGLLEKQEKAAQAAALLRADEERRLLILTSPSHPCTCAWCGAGRRTCGSDALVKCSTSRRGPCLATIGGTGASLAAAWERQHWTAGRSRAATGGGKG